jgi:hypothetical protein
VTNICRIQEFVLAEKDPEMHLGHVSITWEAFRIYAVGFCAWDVAHDHITRVPDLLGCLINLVQPTMVVACLTQLRLSRSSYTLADIIMVTALFQATDPRDKVYGILGLLESSADAKTITVDYSRTPHEVFIDCAKVIMTSEPFHMYWNFTLQPLRENDGGKICGIDGLPTWVVDLTRPPYDLKSNRTYHRPEYFIPTYLRINPKKAPIAHISADNALHTIGAYIGTIVETSQDLFFKGFHFDSVTDILYHIYTKMLKPRNISVEHMMDTILKYGIGSDVHDEGIDLSSQYLAARIQERIPKTKLWDAKLQFCIHERILFVTSEGHLGFSYHPDTTNGIRPGDVVVGLFSSNFPFILRKTQSGEYYQMINIAYVGGHVCSHPAIDNAPEGTTEEDIWNDMGKFGVEEYTIV